jgi:hypothetical protein
MTSDAAASDAGVVPPAWRMTLISRATGRLRLTSGVASHTAGYAGGRRSCLSAASSCEVISQDSPRPTWSERENVPMHRRHRWRSSTRCPPPGIRGVALDALAAGPCGAISDCRALNRPARVLPECHRRVRSTSRGLIWHLPGRPGYPLLWTAQRPSPSLEPTAIDRRAPWSGPTEI